MPYRYLIAKLHRIQCPRGFAPDPTEGPHSAPRLLAGYEWHGREKKGENGKGRDGKGKEDRGERE